MDDVIGKVFACKKEGVNACLVVSEDNNACCVIILSADGRYPKYYVEWMSKRSLEQANPKYYENDMLYILYSDYMYDTQYFYNKDNYYNNKIVSNKYNWVISVMRSIILDYKNLSLEECVDIFNKVKKNTILYKK